MVVPRLCELCHQQKPALRRPKTGQQICRDCFYSAFENEIHSTIVENRLFKPGDRVAIAASGGKDSTVLAHIMTLLNTRHNYGLDLFLLSIDEGITGYRDDSLETVKRNEVQYGVPLEILSYKTLYGWTMDEIVKEIGRKNNCTFCGVFRRQALDRGAAMLNADKMVTGHNADDLAETILLNLLRGDIGRLSRCTAITTGEEGALPRCKPFKYTYEKEIVMYAYFKKLDYFSTECIYSPNAYRGYTREFIKDLESIRPRAILDVRTSGEDFQIAASTKMSQQGVCKRCGYISSQVHDFGFLQYDPEAVQFMEYEAIPLAPEAAVVGLDIRVLGNDSGEKRQLARSSRSSTSCSLLYSCNSRAMEALPIFLDNMFNPAVAVILSVTFV